MPHLTIQATPNVSISRPESLLKALNQALWNSSYFGKPTDIKARLLPIESFLMGVDDDEQEHGFIYAQLKLMPGRDEVIRHQLAEIISDTLKNSLSADQSGRATLQICVEVEELSTIYHKKYM